MAKIKFGALMVDARGKIGGTVFSKNRSGAYIRNKVTPSNPQTESQMAARSALSGFASGFRGLTLAQIDAWNAAVNDYQSTNVFGDTVKKTGLNLFVGLNSIRTLLGLSQLNDPPAPVEVPFTTVTVSDDDAAALDLDLDAIPVGNTYIVEATQPVSPGRNNINNLFRVIGTIAGTGAAITGSSQAANYAAKFGAPAVGQKVGFRVKVAVNATGQTGLPATAQAIVS